MDGSNVETSFIFFRRSAACRKKEKTVLQFRRQTEAKIHRTNKQQLGLHRAVMLHSFYDSLAKKPASHRVQTEHQQLVCC